MEKKYPIGEARIYFVFKHPKTGEEMSSKMYTPLELLDTDLSIINERTCVCDCKPVGETNVVECNCEDYYQDFEFHSYHVELAHTPVNVEQATPQSIGWVKASTRLPENDHYHNCKANGGPIVLFYDNEAESFYDADGEEYPVNEVEWLDEPNNAL